MKKYNEMAQRCLDLMESQTEKMALLYGIKAVVYALLEIARVIRENK